MKARSSVSFLEQWLAPVLSLSLAPSVARALTHALARTLTGFHSHSRTYSLTFPQFIRAVRRGFQMQIRVSPTPSLLDTSPDNRRLTSRSCILGKIAAGNLKLYLPFLLKEIQANPKRQYLLLHSLKEVCKNVFLYSGPHFLIHTVTYFTTLRKVSRHFMMFHTMQFEGARRGEFSH